MTEIDDVCIFLIPVGSKNCEHGHSNSSVGWERERKSAREREEEKSKERDLSQMSGGVGGSDMGSSDVAVMNVCV